MSSFTSNSDAGHRYLLGVALTTLLGLLLVAALNWAVDPYSVFGTAPIDGFNATKVDFVQHLRFTKARIVEKVKPTAIILGTSRAGKGLTAEHPAWDQERVYNLSAPSLNIYEMLRFFEHAHTVGRLARAVLALDYRSFMTDQVTSGLSDARLLAADDSAGSVTYRLALLHDMAAALLSHDALTASLRSVRRQAWTSQVLFPDGHWGHEGGRFVQRNVRRTFRSTTVATFDRLDEILREGGGAPVGYQHFRRLLQIAYRDGIDLRILFSPSHAWHWEAFRIRELWAQLESLKRTLVVINEEESAKAGASPFPLWDFSGYNEITTEPVPAGDTPNEVMRGCWEPIHYKPEVGDLILEKVLRYPGPARGVPPDFGVLLTRENIAERFEEWRAARARYAHSFPTDVEEVERLAVLHRLGHRELWR